MPRQLASVKANPKRRHQQEAAPLRQRSQRLVVQQIGKRGGGDLDPGQIDTFVAAERGREAVRRLRDRQFLPADEHDPATQIRDRRCLYRRGVGDQQVRD